VVEPTPAPPSRTAPTFRSARRSSGGGNAGKIIVLLIVAAALGGAAWYFFMGPGAQQRRQRATADSLAAAAAADSVRRADSLQAAANAPGVVRVSGDFPEDVIISLDGEVKNSRTFTAAPGSHLLEIETSEFEPWERRITVRVGDTTRVFVELILKEEPEN
jgi:hypothetical protein